MAGAKRGKLTPGGMQMREIPLPAPESLFWATGLPEAYCFEKARRRRGGEAPKESEPDAPAGR